MSPNSSCISRSDCDPGSAAEVRTLMLLPGLPRTGPIVSVRDLTRHLLSFGVSVEVLALAPQKGDSMQSEFERLQVPVFTFDSNRFDYPQAIFRLQRFIRARDYDIVQSTLLRPDCFVSLLRATRVLRHTRPLLVTTVRSRPEEEARFSLGRLGATMLARTWVRAWREFDAIIPLGQGIREALVEHGVPSSRMLVINNGVDTSHFCSPTADQRQASRAALGFSGDEVVLGSTSRLVKLKAVHMVLRAMAAITPSTKLRFLAVGGGPEAAALRSLSAQLGLEDRVTWVGECRDVRQFLHAMDVFVLPSLTEGLPSGLIEAGACGLPAVVSDIPGCRDVVVSGETGLSFQAGDIAHLTRALRTLAADVALRTALGKNSRARVDREFAVSQMARRYAALYRALLSQPSSARSADASELASELD